jgi:hypothetical protein
VAGWVGVFPTGIPKSIALLSDCLRKRRSDRETMVLACLLLAVEASSAGGAQQLGHGPVEAPPRPPAYQNGRRVGSTSCPATPPCLRRRTRWAVSIL